MNQHSRTKEQVSNIARGGYVLKESLGIPQLIIIATGSEVDLAAKAFDKLTESGYRIRLVSMPSPETFDSQEEQYKESVLPSNIRARLAVEAASALYWERYVGLDGKVVGMTTFGESAPAEELFKVFGFTVDNIIENALSII